MTQNSEDIFVEALEMPGYLAHHATRVFDRLVSTVLKPHGVTIAVLGPLLLLARRGPMLQRDLARALGLGQPAMVPILSKMEALGFIERIASPSDRRAAAIHLTEAGREKAAIGKQLLIDANLHGLEGFSTQETAVMVGLLKRLIANFENATGKLHQM